MLEKKLDSSFGGSLFRHQLGKDLEEGEDGDQGGIGRWNEKGWIDGTQALSVDGSNDRRIVHLMLRETKPAKPAKIVKGSMDTYNKILRLAWSAVREWRRWSSERCDRDFALEGYYKLATPETISSFGLFILDEALELASQDGVLLPENSLSLLVFQVIGVIPHTNNNVTEASPSANGLGEGLECFNRDLVPYREESLTPFAFAFDDAEYPAKTKSTKKDRFQGDMFKQPTVINVTYALYESNGLGRQQYLSLAIVKKLLYGKEIR
ncbi:hypothetical protein EV360DRAFT_67908 [Lentinula raphanica]|nr:hypothetical protein EV360DRAFT_67908 [Lentinula raphanica]